MVVVREVEGCRARERESIGSDELWTGERAYPAGAVRGVPGDRELLDCAAVPRVVHDEEVGVGFVWPGGVNVEPQWVEIVILRVPFQGDSPRRRANSAHVVKPERPSGVRITQRTHDRVPGLAVGVTAKQQDLVDYGSVVVDPLPENRILAILHVVGRRVLDDGAMSVVPTLCIITMWKIGGWKENISRTSAVAPECKPLHE